MTPLAIHDQENAVCHIGLGTKTPRHKVPQTPFTAVRNDENAVGPMGKAGLATATKRADAKPDANAFVTPAGPRKRPPLGLKTTNAKSRAFQTPLLPPHTKAQKASPRLRRHKVKVHQPDIDHHAEDVVPEVEYMPPKELSFERKFKDDFAHEWRIPNIKDQAMRHGIWEAYHNPTEDDGRTRKQRQFEEDVQRELEKRDQEFNISFEKPIARDLGEFQWYRGTEELWEHQKGPPYITPKIVKHSISTHKHRSSDSSLPSFSVSTVSTTPLVSARSHATTGLVAGKHTTKPPPRTNTSHYPNVVITSKKTITNAQARMPSAARPPLSNVAKLALFPASHQSTTATALNVHNADATASAASIRDSVTQYSSSSTHVTLFASEVGATIRGQQPCHPTSQVQRELELLILSSSEREADDSATNLANRSGNPNLANDLSYDECEDFAFQLPDEF